jgi:hypothetical protein
VQAQKQRCKLGAFLGLSTTGRLPTVHLCDDAPCLDLSRARYWLHAEACGDSSPSSLALTSEMFSEVSLEACKPAPEGLLSRLMGCACKAGPRVSCVCCSDVRGPDVGNPMLAL